MAQRDKFTDRLNQMHGSPVSPQDAADAFHNLAGFMGVLLRINERVGLVALDGKETPHADQ